MAILVEISKSRVCSDVLIPRTNLPISVIVRCGKCDQEHKCKQKCERTLFCGHVCGRSCHGSTKCNECMHACVVKCVHSKCIKGCSEVVSINGVMISPRCADFSQFRRYDTVLTINFHLTTVFTLR